jgi:hypothetical protein
MLYPDGMPNEDSWIEQRHGRCSACGEMVGFTVEWSGYSVYVVKERHRCPVLTSPAKTRAEINRGWRERNADHVREKNRQYAAASRARKKAEAQ